MPPVDPCLSYDEHRTAFDDHADAFYLGVPEAAYHGVDACSASRLTLVMRSPAHAEHAIRNPTPSTSAQRLGSAVHRACLQRETFDGHYVVTEHSSRGVQGPRRGARRGPRAEQ